MLDLTKERIVITGGAGFLGRHVVAELKRRGVPEGQVFTPSRVGYDLIDMNETRHLYDDFHPSVVIHLAAEVGGIGANQMNPGRFFYANMQMGMNMIEQARRRRDFTKFVQVGTVCSYPKFAKAPFKEDTIWDGYPEETNAPYGIAKKSLLVMLQAYREQYGLNGIYLIPVNLYGHGDNFDPKTSHVIPAMIREFVEAKKASDDFVTLWGTGKCSREFLHVTDCARGIVLATERYNRPAPVNLGSGNEISIARLASAIKFLTGYEGEVIWDRTKPDGQPQRSLDVSRARELFDFEASIDLSAGLTEVIEWYNEYWARTYEASHPEVART